MFHHIAIIFSSVITLHLVSGIVVSTCGQQKTWLQDTFEELYGNRNTSVNTIELIPADQHKAVCREVLTSNLFIAREIPYREDPSWSQLALQIEKIQLGNSFTILEKVLPCEPQVDTNGKVQNFFLADGYKPNTYFLHLQNDEDTLMPFAIAERGPSIDQVFKLDDPAAIPKAEQEYIDLRMKHQYSKTSANANALNLLTSEQRFEMCKMIIEHPSFHDINLTYIDKELATNAEVFSKVHQFSFNLHYMPGMETDDGPLQPVYPIFRQVLFGSSTVVDAVLPCVAKHVINEQRDVVTDIFLSNGYEKNTTFVHIRDSSRNLSPAAIVEQGPQDEHVTRFTRVQYGVEHYSQQRKRYAELPWKPVNPLFGFKYHEKCRLVKLILDSRFFKRSRMRFAGLDNDTFEPKPVVLLPTTSDLNEPSETPEWTHEVFSFWVEDVDKGKSNFFYIGWGLDNAKSVYLFTRYDKKRMRVGYYISDVSMIPRIHFPTTLNVEAAE